MIKTGILVPLAAILVLASCGQKETSIKGTLVNAEGETVRLERLSSTASTPVDSAEVSSSGDFKLSAGEITEAGFYRFKINENNFVILLLDKGENVELNGNALDFYQSYEVEGSEGSAKLRSLDQRLRLDYNKTDSLRKSFQAFQQQGHPRFSHTTSFRRTKNGNLKSCPADRKVSVCSVSLPRRFEEFELRAAITHAKFLAH